MKVVLFCGGQGLRSRDGLGEGLTHAPKPLQLIGDRPLLWHIMTWYARFGHTDFILCTGYRADAVRDWILRHGADVEVLRSGSAEHAVRLIGGDMDGWRVTFAETGGEASVGMRLRAVRHLVQDEPLFFANYADVFCDIALPDLVALAERSAATATFLAVRPNHSFHVVEMSSSGRVTAITPAGESDQWINGGYFILRPAVFDVLGPGEDLVDEPFARLIATGDVIGHRHRGFWAPLDTAKDRQRLEALWTTGERPWTKEWSHRLPKQARPAPALMC